MIPFVVRKDERVNQYLGHKKESGHHVNVNLGQVSGQLKLSFFNL